MASSLPTSRRVIRGNTRLTWLSLRDTDQEERWTSAQNIPKHIRDHERVRWGMVADDPDDVDRAHMLEDEGLVTALGPVIERSFVTSGWHMDPNVPTAGSPSLASAEPGPFYVPETPDLVLAPEVRSQQTDWEGTFAARLHELITHAERKRKWWLRDLQEQYERAIELGQASLTAALSSALDEIKACKLPLELHARTFTRSQAPAAWKEHESSLAQCKTAEVIAAIQPSYRCEHCDAVRGYVHYTTTAHWYVECRDCGKTNWLNLVPCGLATTKPLDDDIYAAVDTWKELKVKVGHDTKVARIADRLAAHEQARAALIASFRVFGPPDQQEAQRARFTRELEYHVHVEENAKRELTKLVDLRRTHPLKR